MNLMQPWNIIKHQTIIRPGRDLCPYYTITKRVNGWMDGGEGV